MAQWIKQRINEMSAIAATLAFALPLLSGAAAAGEDDTACQVDDPRLKQSLKAANERIHVLDNSIEFGETRVNALAFYLKGGKTLAIMGSEYAFIGSLFALLGENGVTRAFPYLEVVAGVAWFQIVTNMQYTGPEIIYTGNFEWRIRNGLPDVPQIEQAFADARESVNKFYAEYAAQLEKKRSARKLGWDDVEEMQINYVTAQAHLKLDRAERGILGRIRLQLLACINGYELAPGVTEAQGAFDTDARDSKQTAAPGDGNHYKTVERNMPGSEAVK